MPALLPDGATGIEFGDFAIEFRGNKVIVLAKAAAEHYTLQFGRQSGVLDVHRTWTDTDGTPRHQTIFAIRHEDLAMLLNELVPPTATMFHLCRRLRIGWLKRHNIGIVKGLEPMTATEIAAVTHKRPGRKRLVIDTDKLSANVFAPEYLDEVWDFPDGAFSLFAGNRRIGIGMKATDKRGRVRLYWFRLRDLSRFSRTMQDRLFEAASRYAIPPGKYTEYDMLEP
jgi:hypothetical protein